MTTFRCKPNPNWSMYFEARCLEDIDIAREKGLFEQAHFTVHVGWESGYQPERELGYFKLHPMPGCCGVVVSTDSFLELQERGTFSKQFHYLKEYVAKELGYSLMLATTQTSNFPELIGAAKNGWKLHPAFINRRTNHQLTVMEKVL